MSRAHNFSIPPKLEHGDNYENWEKSLKLWRLITDIPNSKQGAALVLQLSGKARESALELTIEQINGENGIDEILEKLGGIYKKDNVDTAYEAFENFISFKRDSSMNITDYIVEFEKRYSKAKIQGFELSSSSLAFFLLNQAKLSEDHKKLVRATITKLDLDEMKTKLKKVFGAGDRSTINEEVRVKVEDINLADDDEDVLYGNYNGHRNTRSENRFQSRGFNQAARQRGASGGHASNNNYRSFQPNWKQKSSNNYPDRRKKLRCNICESTYHLSYNCPEKVYYNAGEEEPDDYDVVLYQSNLVTDNDFKTFVVESSASAILDSGASANVAGVDWFESYVDGLSEKQLQDIKYYDSESTFRFGSGVSYKSLYKAEIPAMIGSKRVLISTDVVETSVPLLLSKHAMKKASTNIDFVKDEVSMFGEKQNVHLTNSGHYAIPLNNSKLILKHMNDSDEIKINLVAKNDMSKKKMAYKLHSQFGHPAKGKLINLIERAGLGKDKELIAEVGELSKSCKICKEFSKPSPTPIVGLPHAVNFNETVALDLKFFNGHIILHLIDHLTRFSSAVICKSKEPSEILEGIYKCWIAVFGSP